MLFIGLTLFFGSILFILSLIWLIIAKLRKKNLKAPLALTALTLLSVLSAFLMLRSQFDYKVLDNTDGDNLVSLIENGEDLKDKTLIFTVAAVGEDSEIGVGLAVPTSNGNLSVALPKNEQTSSIHIGDKVLVNIKNVASLFELKILQAEFQDKI